MVYSPENINVTLNTDSSEFETQSCLSFMNVFMYILLDKKSVAYLMCFALFTLFLDVSYSLYETFLPF